MITLIRNIWQGMSIGFRTRNSAFLGILAIAVAFPCLTILLTAWVVAEPLSLELMTKIGPPLPISVLFMIYLVCIKALQFFHVTHNNSDKAKALVKQVDVVVMAILFALVAAPLFR